MTNDAMTDDTMNYDVPKLAAQLDGALASLESALAQAGQSVTIIRTNIAQISTLAKAVREMEAAITLARQNLSLPLAARQATDTPPLRAVPQPEPVAETIAPEPVAETTEQPEPVAEATAPEPVAGTTAPEPAAGEAASHCLRLSVQSKSGSLDLKAVDRSVNENPAVVDVALLDYDGRKATLKLWVNESADPIGVREALLGSLRRHLGDEQATELSIDFEQTAA